MRFPWKFWNLFSTRYKNSNRVFYFPVCFLNRMGQNPNLAAFTSKIKGFAYQNGPKGEGTPWKLILTIFKCKNGFPKQLGREKKMNEPFFWFSCLLSDLWYLNCHKLCHFCDFLLMSAKNQICFSSLCLCI